MKNKLLDTFINKNIIVLNGILILGNNTIMGRTGFRPSDIFRLNFSKIIYFNKEGSFFETKESRYLLPKTLSSVFWDEFLNEINRSKTRKQIK